MTKPKATIPKEDDPVLNQIKAEAAKITNHKFSEVQKYVQADAYAELRVVTETGGVTAVKTFWVKRLSPANFESGEITA